MLRILPRTVQLPLLSRSFSYESVSLSHVIPLPPILATPSTPPPSEITVSRLKNGITIASNSCYSPISQLSIAIRAGSRYQDEDNLGVAHFLLHNAFLTNSDRTGFRVTRELERIGATLNSELTRDLLVSTSSFTSGYAESVLENLSAVYNGPEFRRWEVSKDRVLLDLDRLHIHFDSLADDVMHKLAYRIGLGMPIYTPECRAALISSEDMQKYYSSRVNADNTFVIGSGIEHKELSRLVEELFVPPVKQVSGVDIPRYFGKGESHIRLYGEDTQAVLTAEGVSIGHDDLPKYIVLQHLLGVENVIKRGSMSCTRLGKCATQVNGAAMSAVNINHSDTGLFGLVARAPGNQIKKLVKAGLSACREVAKNGVSSTELIASKNRAKSAVLSQYDDLETLHNTLMLQVAMTGAVSSGREISDRIEKVSSEDVQNVARKITIAKPNLVVTGNLVDPPYLDELI
ncbi:Cytochrome b-c1 complex subunit 2, mitochondrial [Oopsacas minuta]|uniref:Cytochrome b-c1 complex subunit 2, mitochondrial n=1 Tax=Oopsacas minuta TaxID=111878 RepID=A0AAV7KFM1_9METZ|nr:Cytochrome b-c1 complex subunit 2, mitochondrial [Oopsacas minuta]